MKVAVMFVIYIYNRTENIYCNNNTNIYKKTLFTLKNNVGSVLLSDQKLCNNLSLIKTTSNSQLSHIKFRILKLCKTII